MRGGRKREAEGLHAKFYVNVFIVSASGGRKPQFWVNFDFGGPCTGPFLPMTVKFGVLKQTKRIHLHAKFHLNVFIVSASSGHKSQFWANFDSWGLLYRPAFTDEGQILCAKADRTSTLTCQISSECVYCVHCVAFRWPKTTILGKF